MRKLLEIFLYYHNSKDNNNKIIVNITTKIYLLIEGLTQILGNSLKP